MNEKIALLNTSLQPVVAIAVIFASVATTIYYLKKLDWHVQAVAIAIALCPSAFVIAGFLVFSFQRMPIAASALFTIAFMLQIVLFVRSQAPPTRSDIMWFGLSCCAYTASVIFVVSFDLAARMLELISGNMELIRELSKVAR